MKLVFILKVGVLSLMTACLFCCAGHTSADSDGLQCEAIKVKEGYGYIVVHEEDTLIYQPFIPAVSGKIPFATKEDALKIGELVCRKLSEHQLPTVTQEELTSSGIRLK
ncbi:MAG: DUF4907 domain-containing protein [Bacteroides sp.]|nr:DUF4907 domain-containing protein [Bacteroides sp.]